MARLGLSLLAALALSAPAQASPERLARGFAIVGPQVVGDETFWGDRTGAGEATRYLLQAKRPGEPARALLTRPAPFRTVGDVTFSRSFSFVASATHVALGEREESSTAMNDVGEAALSWGPHAGPLREFAHCESDEFAPEPPLADADGARLALAIGQCPPATAGIAVLEGETRTPVAVTEQISNLDLAGDWIAYRGHGVESPFIVVNWRTGTEAYRVTAGYAALGPDGSLAVARPDFARGDCRGGTLAVHTPAQPAGRIIEGARPCGLPRVAGGAIGYLDPEDRVHRVTPDGVDRVVMSGVPVESFDLGDRRVAVSTPVCAGVALYSAAFEDVIPAAPASCPAQLRRRTLRVRGRGVAVPLRCPRGCEGTLTLRTGAGPITFGGFGLQAPGGSVRLGLARDDRRRLARRGRTRARLRVWVQVPGRRPVSRIHRVVIVA